MAPKKPKPPQGIAGYELLRDFSSIPECTIVNIRIPCSDGKMVLGEGFKGPSKAYFRIYVNGPDDGADAWLIRAHNYTSSDQSLTSYAICADAACNPTP